MARMMIHTRDFNYIESRLIAPAGEGLEALQRLRGTGNPDLESRLMEATQKYVDECRAIRHVLTDRQFQEKQHA